MPYDPTFDLVWRENREPDEDEFTQLLSIGCSPDEASMILDADLLSFDDWIEAHSEEVTPDNYSTLVII